MAITNAKIISGACDALGIVEPVDTFAGWKRQGYTIRRGEKALFTAQIWKPCKVKNPDKEGETKQKLLFVKAAFFGKSQVIVADNR